MRTLLAPGGSVPRLLFVAIALLVGCSSSEEPDAIVTCSSTTLPKTGQRCDPSAVPATAYCRLISCDTQCGDECACGADGHWRCTNSCRDWYGCGTPPLCGVGCSGTPTKDAGR